MSAEDSEDGTYRRLQRRHVVLGWWTLAAFALLGMAMEALHGFKVSWFLDPAFETRRLLWRLAHAHGTLLSLVQLGFAASLPHTAPRRREGLRLTSSLLLAALCLLPLGFFLGGLTVYGGDPGPGILLAPIGALCFVAGALRTALSFSLEGEDDA